ncbi:MAG: DUF3072 domain-containing protein [Pseudolabrys sp.]|jgi:hypothetical protein
MPKGEASGAHERMTAGQAERLKALAHDAYEPEAFSPSLTAAEAERRIATLSAKLTLLDGPPHVT